MLLCLWKRCNESWGSWFNLQLCSSASFSRISASATVTSSLLLFLQLPVPVWALFVWLSSMSFAKIAGFFHDVKLYLQTYFSAKLSWTSFLTHYFLFFCAWLMSFSALPFPSLHCSGVKKGGKVHWLFSLHYVLLLKQWSCFGTSFRKKNNWAQQTAVWATAFKKKNVWDGQASKRIIRMEWFERL